MVGVFYCIVYEVVYIIRESTVTFRIQYIGSLYEVVYFIPVTAYTSIRLYEYPLIRVSAYMSIRLYEYPLIRVSAAPIIHFYANFGDLDYANKS